MKVRIVIPESKGGGEAPETLISEGIIQTESHKRLTRNERPKYWRENIQNSGSTQRP